MHPEKPRDSSASLWSGQESEVTDIIVSNGISLSLYSNKSCSLQYWVYELLSFNFYRALIANNKV